MDTKKSNHGGLLSTVGTQYIWLALLRILVAIVPQTGYIHPDEYFQSTEILIGDFFNAERSEVWEYDSKSPVRSIFVTYIVYGLPISACRWILNYLNFQGTVSPYYLLIPTRVFICLLSFIVDFSLASICIKCGTDIKSRLFLVGSSYVMLVYGSRTFSNTIEMIVFAALLRTVVFNVLDAEKAYPRETKLKASLQIAENPRQKILILRQLKQLSHRNYSGSVKIAVLCVFGIFNRPTFIAYAIGPLFFWLYRGRPVKKLSLYTVHLRWACLITVGIPVALGLIAADTWYYKREKPFDLLFNSGITACLNRVTDCFVITPINFIKYNWYTENLSIHGIHPRYLHVVNLVMLYNVVTLCCFQMLTTVLTNLLNLRNVVKFNSVTALMFTSVVIPMVVLSIFPHQEPRFLIPLTLPVIFLGASILNNEHVTIPIGSEYKGQLMTTWIAINMAFAIFFGYMHQAGVLPALNHLTSVRNGIQRDGVRMHIISSHTYSLPKSLLTNTVPTDRKQRSNKRSGVIMYPTTSSSFEVSMQQLETVSHAIDRNVPHDDLIYFLFPSTLIRNFTQHRILKRLNVKYSVERYIFTHISTEALPKLDWQSVFNLKPLSEIGLNVVALKSVKYPKSVDKMDGYFSSDDDPTIEQLYAKSSYSIF